MHVAFRSALSQWRLPKFENWRETEVRNCPIIVNLREVIASSGGKELIQVTNDNVVPAAINGVGPGGHSVRGGFGNTLSNANPLDPSPRPTLRS